MTQPVEPAWAPSRVIAARAAQRLDWAMAGLQRGTKMIRSVITRDHGTVCGLRRVRRRAGSMR